jgi:uncharacterized protein YbbK (DUF523 family)
MLYFPVDGEQRCEPPKMREKWERSVKLSVFCSYYAGGLSVMRVWKNLQKVENVVGCF